MRAANCCVSIIGGIQPSRLRECMGDAIRGGGPSDDGMIQRFQILVWPDAPAEWQNVDRVPDAEAESKVAKVFEKLANMNPATPLVLGFSPDGQELFNEWWTRLGKKLRSGEEQQAVLSHLSKYRSLMPSLALLFELADWASTDGCELGSISLDHARQAAAFCVYLESHARRVYSTTAKESVQVAHDLGKKIMAGRLGTVFTCREVYLKGWSNFDTAELVLKAAEVLVDARWLNQLAPETCSMGGRPSEK